MERKLTVIAWMAFVIAASPLIALAQFQPRGAEQPAQGGAQPQREATVIATVNGDPITQKEVEASLQPKLQGRQVDPRTAAQMRKQALTTLIDSRLIEQYVLEKGPAVQEQEVDALIDRFKGQLAAQQISLNDYAATRGYTVESFYERIKGSLAWQKFQQEKLTNENLARYFQQHQQRFEAENFEEARPAVTNAYIGDLWKQIIGQMKPEAEIRMAPEARPVPQQLPDQPPQQRLP